ncbi:MAG: PepSY domain-containing protein [Anaeromyxobacter sp.]|nr:PepSY domain-containing protein [Anaeromyxobacter sp.]MBL0274861.1 PepSY domain-containing protein [Anaeromyxobacter sp.]
MGRKTWVLVHRWAGLLLAGFLLVVGLTGSALAFRPQLRAWLDPPLRVADAGRPPLDPLTLRERALALVAPWGRVDGVLLHREPGEPFEATISPGDEGSGPVDPLPFDRLLLDPATGAVLLRETVPAGLWPITRRNLLDLMVAVHYRLAVPGEVGTWLLGLVALLWTFDCFVGAYLTFPAPRRGAGAGASPVAAGRSWLARWWPAWQVKAGASARRRTYDLHRAGGLWPWLLLLVLAWSGVAFNLREQVYEPVTRVLIGTTRNPLDGLAPVASAPLAGEPGWPEALETGRRLMAGQAAALGFRVEREGWLISDRPRGLWFYAVRSDRDVAAGRAETVLAFEEASGRLAALALPTGQRPGVTTTTWLSALHRGSVGGLAYRWLLFAVGLAVALLSSTGVWLWWRRRRVRPVPSASERPFVAPR